MDPIEQREIDKLIVILKLPEVRKIFNEMIDNRLTVVVPNMKNRKEKTHG